MVNVKYFCLRSFSDFHPYERTDLTDHKSMQHSVFTSREDQWRMFWDHVLQRSNSEYLVPWVGGRAAPTVWILENNKQVTHMPDMGLFICECVFDSHQQMWPMRSRCLTPKRLFRGGIHLQKHHLCFHSTKCPELTFSTFCTDENFQHYFYCKICGIDRPN